MSIIEKPGSKRATYQDVLDAPQHKVAEVIDGVLYTMPRADSSALYSGFGARLAYRRTVWS